VEAPRLRLILLGLCCYWQSVSSCIDDIERVLRLAGMLHLNYPSFTTVNRRVADLQDLIFNETWFLIEGLLWASSAKSTCVLRVPASGG
jgi:hypothetical protein